MATSIAALVSQYLTQGGDDRIRLNKQVYLARNGKCHPGVFFKGGAHLFFIY
jgi:hypothetical protein